MTVSDWEIIRIFKGYLNKCGGDFGDWYIGVSENAVTALREKHNVNSNDYCICRQVSSGYAAREICDYFIKVLGVDGVYCFMEECADMVYAYKKTDHTRQ